MPLKTLIHPRPLRLGDTLSCVAPAGKVDLAAWDRARDQLERRGFRIKTYRDVGERWRYCAGTDEARASELMAAFTDPESSAVLPIRGGYGVTRLLPLLDYEAIRRHPKVFAGFSDNTALHAALQTQCGLVTFHAPNLADGLGAEQGLSTISESTYWRALQGSTDASVGYKVDLPDASAAACLGYTPGRARGRLVGGNLALVCTLLGTPYRFSTRGCLLLLEDVNEPPYRLDRYLSQLKLAGVLEDVAGVLLGQFSGMESDVDQHGTSIQDVLADYFRGFHAPVLGNFPFGHARDNVTLPLGVDVELDVERGCVTILESAVRQET